MTTEYRPGEFDPDRWRWSILGNWELWVIRHPDARVGAPLRHDVVRVADGSRRRMRSFVSRGDALAFMVRESERERRLGQFTVISGGRTT